MQKEQLKSQKQISFEGKGEVLTQYYKLSEESFLEKILPELKSKIEQILKIDCNSMDFGFFKKKALELHLANENGELVGLTPQTVIIKDGEDIIPDNFKAHKVFQKGGEIDGQLTGEEITVSGGKNSGVTSEGLYTQIGQNSIVEGEINAQNLSAQNTTFNHPVNVGDIAELTDVSVANEMRVQGDLRSYGSTKFLKDSNVDVGQYAVLSHQTEVSGKMTAHGDLRTYENAKLAAGSNVKVGNNAILRQNSTIAGEMYVSRVLRMEDNTQLAQGSNVEVHQKAVLRQKSTVAGKMQVAKALYMEGDAQLAKGANVNVELDAFLNSGKIIGKLNVGRNATVKRPAKLVLGSEVNVAKDAFLEGTAASKLNVRGVLTAGYAAKLLESSRVYAKAAIFRGRAWVRGYFSGQIQQMERGVQINYKTAKFSDEAKKTLPIRRKFLYAVYSLMPKPSMKV